MGRILAPNPILELGDLTPTLPLLSALSPGLSRGLLLTMLLIWTGYIFGTDEVRNGHWDGQTSGLQTKAGTFFSSKQ